MPRKRDTARVLVTGATGMLGSSLVRTLTAQGKTVRVLLLPNTWHPLLEGLDLEVVHGDVCDIAAVRMAMRGCAQVYHLVGIVSYQRRDAMRVERVNIGGTRNVLTAAKEQQVRVVVTASTAGIGISEGMELLNEDSPFPARYRDVAYMRSKHQVIVLCKQFATQGVKVCAVSPTTIYGQGDSTMHIGKLVQKIKRGNVRWIPPGGNAVVSVDDTVAAHLLAMAKGRSGENYIVAHECVSYAELYVAIGSVLGVRVTKRVLPAWIRPIGSALFVLIERGCAILNRKTPWPVHVWNCAFKFRYFDATKARRELGWKPKEDFRSAMRKALAFYRREGLL